jgi:REP element-mobilizing transposase RayT
MYFVTICTHRRRCIFGDIVDSDMRPNALGRIVAEEWHRSAEIRREIMLDAFVIMPNHMHGIVHIEYTTVGATGRSPLRRPDPGRYSLSSFVGGFKAATTTQINGLRGTPRQPVWQRNYYEHIIREERDLDPIRDYISANPANWPTDRENPALENPQKQRTPWQV